MDGDHSSHHHHHHHHQGGETVASGAQSPGFFEAIFSTHGFFPHGHCYLWEPEVLWLHAISDGLIALSYFSIPVALAFFIFQRRDMPFSWVFWMFASFILLCGATHAVEIAMIWSPHYRAQGLLKAVTALASVLTAYALWPLIPALLRIPGRGELQEKNRRLALVGADADRHLREERDRLQQELADMQVLTRSATEREAMIGELQKQVDDLLLELKRIPRYGRGG